MCRNSKNGGEINPFLSFSVEHILPDYFSLYDNRFSNSTLIIPISRLLWEIPAQVPFLPVSTPPPVNNALDIIQYNSRFLSEAILCPSINPLRKRHFVLSFWVSLIYYLKDNDCVRACVRAYVGVYLMCVPNLLKYNARVFVSLIFVSRFRSEENVIALTLWWHGLPDWFLLDVEHFYSCCERLTDSQRVRERERERERQTDRQTEIGREKLHIYKKFLPFRLQPQQTNWLFK